MTTLVLLLLIMMSWGVGEQAEQDEREAQNDQK